MNKLEKQHYEAIKERGLITEETTIYDFLKKVREEYNELNRELYLDAFETYGLREETIQECVDLVQVIKNMLHHNGVDYNKALKKNVEIQLERAKG